MITNMITKIKEKISNWRKKQRPVLFLSIFSYDPISYEHITQIKKIMSRYCEQHNIEFGLFNNALVRPISKQELKQLFEQVYDFKFRKKEEKSNGRKN